MKRSNDALRIRQALHIREAAGVHTQGRTLRNRRDRSQVNDRGLPQQSRRTSDVAGDPLAAIRKAAAAVAAKRG
jgi:hypothetical protein